MADEGQKESSEKPFRLLELPPELWSRIGQLANDQQPAMTRWDQVNYLPPTVFGRKHLCQPAVCRVCRVLRDELLPYYYGTRIAFRFSAAGSSYRNAEQIAWLQTIGRYNRKMLKAIKIIAVPDSVELHALQTDFEEAGMAFALGPVEEEAGRALGHIGLEYCIGGEKVFPITFL